MKIGKQEVGVTIGIGAAGTPIIGLVPKKKTEKTGKNLKSKIRDKSRISSEAGESGKAKKNRLNRITAAILKTAPEVKVVDTAKMSEKEAQKALKSADIIHIMPKGRQSDLGEIAQDSLTKNQGKTVVIVDKMSDKEIEKAVAEGKIVVKAVPRETGKAPESITVGVEGTGYATARVTGVAARLMEANPALKNNPQAVKEILTKAAGKDGQLDAEAALKAAKNYRPQE